MRKRVSTWGTWVVGASWGLIPRMPQDASGYKYKHAHKLFKKQTSFCLSLQP